MAEIEIKLKVSEELITSRSQNALEQVLGIRAYAIAAEVKRKAANAKIEERRRNE